MSKILKGQTMGNSISVPLKTFGIEKGKLYLVKKIGKQIIIEEAEE